jgi:hypothetical protein
MREGDAVTAFTNPGKPSPFQNGLGTAVSQ